MATTHIRTRKAAPAAPAALDDVAEFAKGLSDTKLLCRVNNRHIADPRSTTVRRPTKNDPSYEMTGPCIICGQPVKRQYDEFFGRVRTSGPSIDYDDDYLMPKGSGRISAEGRQVLVQEFMTRAGAVPKKRARKKAASKAEPSNVTPITEAKGA